MAGKYKGSYQKKLAPKKDSFDWSALIYWLLSLLISLIPMYIELIKYLNQHEKIDIDFLKYYFVKGDILWVFSTLLLFVLMDLSLKKRKKEKKWVKNTCLVGRGVFLITEITWILFNTLNISDEVVWPLYIGVPLVILSLIISTPLKIEFIKEG